MTAAPAPVRLPPRPDGLDPHVAALIEALAKDAARADQRAIAAAQATKATKDSVDGP